MASLVIVLRRVMSCTPACFFFWKPSDQSALCGQRSAVRIRVCGVRLCPCARNSMQHRGEACARSLIIVSVELTLATFAGFDTPWLDSSPPTFLPLFPGACTSVLAWRGTWLSVEVVVVCHATGTRLGWSAISNKGWSGWGQRRGYGPWWMGCWRVARGGKMDERGEEWSCVLLS